MSAATARRLYDHRLRQLVTLVGVEAVNDVDIPRSTAAAWRKRTLRAVVSSDRFDAGEVELRARLARAERHVVVLRALVRLLVVLIRVRGARLLGERLPDGRDKAALLAAIERARQVLPLRQVLAQLGLTPKRFNAWRSLAVHCALDDRLPCPRRKPGRLTTAERSAMRDLVEDHDLRHMPLSVLALYAQRMGKVFASASTWRRTVQLFGWRRPRHRVHPKGPRVGVRASAVGELLHVDVSVLRLLDGSRVYRTYSPLPVVR